MQEEVARYSDGHNDKLKWGKKQKQGKGFGQTYMVLVLVFKMPQNLSLVYCISYVVFKCTLN